MRNHALLLTTVLLGGLLFLLPCLLGLVNLFLRPAAVQDHAQLAGVWGWSTLGVVAVGCWITGLAARLTWRSSGLAALFGAAVLLSVFQVSQFDRGEWLSYHTLLAATCAGGFLALAAGWWSARSAAPGERRFSLAVERIVSAAAIVGVILALREAWAYTHPWWSVTALAACCLLFTLLAFARLRRWPLYASTPLLLLAVSIGWVELQTGPWWPLPGHAMDFVYWNLIAVTLPAIVSVVLERILNRFPNDDAETRFRVGCHQWIALASAGLLLVIAVQAVLVNLAGDFALANTSAKWGAVAATIISSLACLWDRRAKGALPQLYFLGLITVAITMGSFDLQPKDMLWTGTMILAAYTILTSYLWSRRRGLNRLASTVGIPCDENSSFANLAWLAPVTSLLTVCVLLSVLGIVLNFEDQWQRIAAGQAAILQGLSFGMLARGERRSPLQLAALCTAALGVISFGWAWLDPPAGQSVLNHAIVVTVVLGGLTALYGAGLAKFFPKASEWTQAALRLTPGLASLAVVSLLIVLGIEASYVFGDQPMPIAPLGIAAVIGCLVVLIAAALIAALVPGRDPLGLTERQRTVYVYATEGLLALMALHIRLTMPWLFQGFFQQFWPYIVVAIAFAGLGLAEVFRRQKRLVLAEPLENTGVLLPLLPVLGFWFAPAGHYSLILIMAGALYGVVSIHRRSFVFGMLSTLAANGALWYYLAGVRGLGFWEHPQLWLIPVSLCSLIAAQINRRQLSEAQLTTVRYLSSVTLYVSSSAEIFIHGMAEAPWSPLVLAGLAIAGVLLGMLLRVRAFLFLGTSFLFLALSTIIWHATVNLQQTWLLWLTVVAAGVAILALFALFEKKRNEVLRMVDSIRKWSP